jgi:hypothetical protein
MTPFEEVAERIMSASTFAQAGGSGLVAYRRMVRIVHPDAVPAALRARATVVAARLNELWRQHDREIVAEGDIATLTAGDDGTVLKVPRSPADNDLMRAEAQALTVLERDGDPRHRAYAPKMIKTFSHEDDAGVRRTAVVLERLTGFLPLTGLEGRLDPRDVAWMWRRLLTGLGWAHRAGIVHGAVLPEHVLIHPGEHGVVLVDWCYSVRAGAAIPAIVSRHRADYPPEVLAKRPATAATDIFMATGLMLRLIKDPPAPIRRFATGCRQDVPRMRPQDAWRLLGELDELLENLYGPRTFRPFTVPQGV